MTFFEAVKTVFRKYAEFGGRAARPEFWWFALFSALVSAALNALSVPVTAAIYGPNVGILSSHALESGIAGRTGYSSVSFAGVWGVVVLLPSLAVTVRRLRDAGRNWTELFWILLPIAGAIVLIVHLAEPTKGVDAAGPGVPAAPPAGPPTEPPSTPPSSPPQADV